MKYLFQKEIPKFEKILKDKMNKLLIQIILIVPISVYGQNIIEKNIKKFGIESSIVATTDEKILLYPRGFIYCKDKPDSVFYLGCISSDIKSIKGFFSKKNDRMISIKQKLIRNVGGDNDTIILENVENKLNRLKSLNDGNHFEVQENTEYVIIYYWCDEVLDKKYIRNIKFINRFAIKNKELSIQTVFVTTDKS